MLSRQEKFAREVYTRAREMGMPEPQARLAAAQASLETAYGRSVRGNNYFGIKAGRSWDGPTQNFKTWEEVNGKRKNITDRFRAYDNMEDSLSDWKRTVERRWPDAAAAETFPDAVEGLRYGRRGGYATDTQYGNKLGYINRKYTGGGMLAPLAALAGPRQKPDAASPTSGEMLAGLFNAGGPSRRARVTGSGSPISSEDVVPGGAPVTPVDMYGLPGLGGSPSIGVTQSATSGGSGGSLSSRVMSRLDGSDVVPGGAPVGFVERGQLADVSFFDPSARAAGPDIGVTQSAFSGGSRGTVTPAQILSVTGPEQPAPALPYQSTDLPPLDAPVSIPERQVAEPLPELPTGTYIPERIVADAPPTAQKGLLRGLKAPKLNPSRVVGALVGSAIGGPVGALAGGLVGPQITRIAGPAFSGWAASGDRNTPSANAIQAARSDGGWDNDAYWREYSRSGGDTSALGFSKAEARRRSGQGKSRDRLT